MLGYSILLFSSRFLKLRDDQAGDNLYYLGFLYTLTSLSVSLWQFTATGATETIIENFGIALSTTIVGVVLRVIFNQMRQDPMEVERTARLELAEAARKVRNELDSAALEFSHFRRGMQQSLTDAAAEMNKHIDSLVLKAAKGWEDLPARSLEPLEKVSAQAATALERLNTTLISGLDDGSKRLFSALEGLTGRTQSVSDQLGQVSKRISSISIPKDIALGKIDDLAKTLAVSIEELHQNSRQQSRVVEAALHAVEDAANTATELADAARDAGTLKAREIDHAVGRIRQVMANLARYISIVKKQPTEAEGKVIDALHTQERRLQRVAELLEQQSNANGVN